MTTAHPAYNPVAWLAIFLCLLTVLVYWPGLSGDYMFDDRSNLLENRQLEMAELSWEELIAATFSSGSGDLRRPVSMASFALNRWFLGIEPFSYKVINLCLHLLTGAGLWLLGMLFMQTLRRQPQSRISDTTARWLPLLVAGLWLVHPLNLTTVLYIVQRMAGLAALFTVAGLCLYTLGRLRMQDGRPGWPLILTGLIVCGSLAVFSKENGVLLPLYMLVIEISLFRFRTGPAHDRRITGLFIVTLALPVLLVLLVLVFKPTLLVNYEVRHFTMLERVLTEARVLVFYLKMIVMPSISELGLFHDDITISRGLLDPPTTLYALLGLSVLLVTAVMLSARQPLLSLGILWFFAGHALESTVISLEIAHEHRNYLADFGILLAGAVLLTRLPLRRLAPPILLGTPVLFLLLFAGTTWLRAGQWSDNINHAVYEARHHPESPRAVFGAGRIFARLALEDVPGAEEKAFAYLEQARALEHSGIMPDTTILKLNYLLDRPVNNEHFTAIKKKLSNEPISASDITSLTILTDCFGGQCNIPKSHMDEILEIAQRKSRSPQLHTAYGYYRINQHSDFDSGLDIFTRIVQNFPREPQYWKNLINLLLVMEQFDEAEQQLNAMTRINLHGRDQTTLELLREEIDRARSTNTAPDSKLATRGESS